MRRIAYTPGEPAGIGAELFVDLVTKGLLGNDNDLELCAICDPELLQASALQLGLEITCKEMKLEDPPCPNQRNQIKVLAKKMAAPVQWGKLDPRNSHYVLETLACANDAAQAGALDAIVTGPVQKSVLNDAGISFSGHTEFFAERSGTDKVVMMLATEGLRVALATTHLPLRQVPDAISASSLSQIIDILLRDLREKFGIESPRVLVAGLNPHAGEGGHLGREEIEIIAPLIDTYRNKGHQLEGPLPADTLFTPPYLARADAVLAMYHDQGLPVLKHMGFSRSINITLGLPYTRTSVDHGTALNLAGKGVADTGSLRLAFQVANDMLRAV